LKKSVILVVIIGLMFVIFALTFAALYLMTQESQVAERKIRFMRAFYAAQAGVVHALEVSRTGASLSNINVGNGVTGYPTGGMLVTVTRNAGGVNGTSIITATATH